MTSAVYVPGMYLPDRRADGRHTLNAVEARFAAAGADPDTNPLDPTTVMRINVELCRVLRALLDEHDATDREHALEAQRRTGGLA